MERKVGATELCGIALIVARNPGMFGRTAKTSAAIATPLNPPV